MKRNSILIFLALIGYINTHAQINGQFSKESIMNNFVQQMRIFPQEKLYLHIDKGTYLPGDTLWFRAYRVDATLHTPVLSNAYIHVELINTMDSVISQALIRFDKNIYHGYLPITSGIADGVYTLRAYTQYMMRNGKDYIFKRPVQIATPKWNRVQLKAVASEPDKKTSISLCFMNPSGFLPVKDAKMVLADKSIKSLKYSEHKLNISWDKSQLEKNKSWLLSFRDDNNNVYQRFLPLSTRNEDYEVSFYPEGGYLLEGTMCRVAFKALGCSGNSSDIRMDVIDSEGQLLTTTQTLYEGMGTFAFTPEKGKEYKARCTDNYGRTRIFQLPSVEAKAQYSLRVDTQRDAFRISLLSAVNASDAQLYLIGHVRGIVIFSEEWKEHQKAYLLPKQYFPAGVVQFLLLNKDGQVISERLAFADTYNPTICDISVDAQLQKKREQVSVDLLLKSDQQVPLVGNYSLSVVDSKFFPVDSCQHILSHLLLTSELKGAIHSPGNYFKKGSTGVRNSLDLLMLTQGWRRYSLPDIIQGKYTKPVLENHTEMALSGRTVTASSLLGKGTNEHLVSVMGIGKAKGFKRFIPTDKKGYFCLDSIEYADGSGFDIEAVQIGGKRTSKIELDTKDAPKLTTLFPQDPLEDDSLKMVQPEEYAGMSRIDNLHFLLQDVVIKAPYWGSRDYKEVSDRETFRYKDMRSLLKGLGLSISTIPESEYADELVVGADSLSVKEEGLELADTDNVDSEKLVYDMIYDHEGHPVILFVDDNYCKPDILVNWIMPGDIENISLVKGVSREKASQLLQGMLNWTEKLYKLNYTDLCQAYSRIKPGIQEITILNVTTKESFDSRCLGWWSDDYSDINQRNQRKMTYYPLGYQIPVEFYSPKYDKANQMGTEVPDVRTTLYWQPQLLTDEKGQASFSFYNSDQPGDYFLIIEGVSEKGDLVHVVKRIIQN